MKMLLILRVKVGEHKSRSRFVLDAGKSDIRYTRLSRSKNPRSKLARGSVTSVPDAGAADNKDRLLGDIVIADERPPLETFPNRVYDLRGTADISQAPAMTAAATTP